MEATTKRFVVVALSASGVVATLAGIAISHAAPSHGAADRIYAVTLPDGCRDWISSASRRKRAR